MAVPPAPTAVSAGQPAGSAERTFTSGSVPSTTSPSWMADARTPSSSAHAASDPSTNEPTTRRRRRSRRRTLRGTRGRRRRTRTCPRWWSSVRSSFEEPDAPPHDDAGHDDEMPERARTADDPAVLRPKLSARGTESHPGEVHDGGYREANVHAGGRVAGVGQGCAARRG